jgi:beta-glucosidase
MANRRRSAVWNSEMRDRVLIDLQPIQLQLVQAVVATGKPTVVVFINGGQVAHQWVKDNVPAILEAFYPGEAGGTAIADVYTHTHTHTHTFFG